jgi:hypothetical protein
VEFTSEGGKYGKYKYLSALKGNRILLFLTEITQLNNTYVQVISFNIHEYTMVLKANYVPKKEQTMWKNNEQNQLAPVCMYEEWGGIEFLLVVSRYCSGRGPPSAPAPWY